MKRTVCLLLCLFFFCACAPAQPDTAELSYSPLRGDLFPLFCVDKDARLWRVERDHAVRMDLSVTASRENLFFSYNAAKDTALVACNERKDTGERLCSLALADGNGEARILAQNVRSLSLRVSSSGTALFLDAQSTLYYYNGQSVSEMAKNVAQAEFLSDGAWIYRLNQGRYDDGEFLYPVYTSDADYSRFLTEAAEIFRVDAAVGRAYLIRSRRTVQKRTSPAETALVSVCDRSDVLFELPSVLLSQFENAPYAPFLLCCDEDAPTLQYRLYRTDGTEPVLLAKSILAGRAISFDGRAYAYEVKAGDTIERRLLYGDEVRTLPVSASSSLSDYYFYGSSVYRLENGALYQDGTPLAQSVSSCRLTENALLCVHGVTPPYGISLCRDGAVTLLSGDVADFRWNWNGQSFWYVSKTDDGLTVSDASGKRTAVLSKIDPDAAFVCVGSCAAAIKDGSLFLACEDQLVRLDLPVRYIING